MLHGSLFVFRVCQFQSVSLRESALEAFWLFRARHKLMWIYKYSETGMGKQAEQIEAESIFIEKS